MLEQNLPQGCIKSGECQPTHAVIVGTLCPGTDCVVVGELPPEFLSYREDLLHGGELKARTPFAGAWPQIVQTGPVATTDDLPAPLLAPLRNALIGRTSGLLMFGSSVITDHCAIDLVAASLALVKHVGPAARIMPRHRSTPAKDWMVPEAICQRPCRHRRWNRSRTSG